MMGSLTLQAPLFLSLLVPLAVLVGGAWRARRGRRLNRSGSVAIVARCVALLLLIVALAQPAWAGTGTGMGTATPVIFVVDTAARTVGAPRAVEQSWLHDVLATLPASALRGLVTFGGSPRLGPAPARADALALASATDPGGTDIASALGLALGAAARGDRLVLLSNGLETTGDARAVAAAASAQGVPIDVVDVGVDQAPDAALTRLQAPASARQGDAIPLLLTVRSTVARRATVALTQDGQPVGQETIRLQKGDNPYLVTAPAPGVGWHAYHASVSMAGDTVPQNNALDAVTHVVGPPRLLVVAAGARDGDGSAALLRRRGFTVDLIAPGKTPATMGALDGYDGLVLDDIPATALSGRQIAAIDGAVRVGGMGLLALGGPHSLTLGQYSQSALDHILPVSSVTLGSLGQGAVALQLVLDRSGSMQNLAGGDVPKIQMAQAAANIAVDFTAQHNDDLGIVSFDQDPHILVPIQRVSGQGSAARIHDTVNGLTADGGTDIYDALRVGLSQILRSNAPYKHMILMTDGVSDPVSYTPLLRLLESHQVTLSTVGLGTDADVTLLQMLARVGKGRFYYTNDASALPRIFADEARLSAGSASVAGKIPVLVAASVPAVRAAAGGALPPVRRYVATVLKPNAVAGLVTPARGHSTDPLLAQWQYGLGRVLVWTPGATASWAGNWPTAAGSVWADAVRWMLRGVSVGSLTPRLVTVDGQPQVDVDTLRNSGAFFDLARLSGAVRMPSGAMGSLTFAQVGPDHYEAVLPGGQPGVYRLSVLANASSSASALVDIAMPYDREYLPRPSDTALLGQLAADTGGRVLTSPRQLTSQPVAAPMSDLWWPLTAVALLFFLVDVALRLAALPRRTGR